MTNNWFTSIKGIHPGMPQPDLELPVRRDSSSLTRGMIVQENSMGSYSLANSETDPSECFISLQDYDDSQAGMAGEFGHEPSGTSVVNGIRMNPKSEYETNVYDFTGETSVEVGAYLKAVNGVLKKTVKRHEAIAVLTSPPKKRWVNNAVVRAAGADLKHSATMQGGGEYVIRYTTVKRTAKRTALGPLCFENVNDNSGDVTTRDPNAQSTVAFEINSGYPYQYSTDGSTWSAYESGTEITLANIGDKVYFRAESEVMAEDAIGYFSITGKVAASGNINSLLSPQGTAVLTYSCYSYMFNGCTGLTTAPELPATTLADGCYSYMFQGCTSLTTAPELPATTLAGYCYYYMFYGCTSLTTAPELPATTLANHCYNSMFYGCTSLTTAPELPATTLADSCYYIMFQGCTGLTEAPSLPATTLADNCYYYMFYGCTSLTTAPELPATTLAGYCYYGMFGGCTSLTTAPELPATTLANYCYYIMFNGCTGLTEAPSLPATTLAYYCYYGMFGGCTSLTTAPELLPATTLAYYCYCYMFSGCTSLTTAPELPATTLANRCYNSMFYGCTSLKVSENGTTGDIILNLPAGTATPNGWNAGMFTGTGGTFTGDPSVGKTYRCYQ